MSAAPMRRAASGSPMAGSFHPLERIVLPIEGTDREFFVQQWGMELAAALGVQVLAVHVGTADEPPPDLFAFVTSAAAKWGVPLQTATVGGRDVATEILTELRTRDLVVMGTRRLGTGFHVGSVASKLVRDAPCPVQLVRLV